MVKELLKLKIGEDDEKSASGSSPSKDSFDATSDVIAWHEQADVQLLKTVRDIIAGKDDLPEVIENGKIGDMVSQCKLYGQVATHRYYQAKVAELMLIKQAWVWRSKVHSTLQSVEKRRAADLNLNKDLEKVGYTLSMLKKRHCMIDFFVKYPRFLYTMTSINDLQNKKTMIEKYFKTKHGLSYKEFFSKELDMDYIDVQVAVGHIEVDEKDREKIRSNIKMRDKFMNIFRSADTVSAESDMA